MANRTPVGGIAVSARRKAEDKAKKDARAKITEFCKTKEYKKLPEDVQDALYVFSYKPNKGGGGAPLQSVSVLASMFDKVGSKKTELEVFMATKKGVPEFRKYVREHLQKATPEARMWVNHDEKTETWSLMAIGGDQPKGYFMDVKMPKKKTEG